MPKKPEEITEDAKIQYFKDHLFDGLMLAKHILDRIKPSQIIPPLSNQVYHYTTPAGAKGIIEQGCLWATHANFLNDLTEGQHGKFLIRETLKNEILKDDKRKAYLSRILEYFEQETKEGVLPQDVYLSCFCEDNDLLSQWRGYANTTGNSIGFSFPDISRLKVKDTKVGGVLFGKVIYDNYQKRAKTVEIIDAIWNDKESSIEAKAFAAYWKLTSFVFFFKDYNFREENEWRAVFSTIQQDMETCVKFRCNSEAVIPYVELNMEESKMPIKTITIGPGSEINYERSRLALTKLLESNGFEGVVQKKMVIE